MSLLEMSRPVQLAGEKRVHRLANTHEDAELDAKPAKAKADPAVEQQRQPEVTAMPRGVYPRKPKDGQPGAEAKPVTKKRKKSATKKAPPARVARQLHAEATFAVDDTGRVTIAQGDQRIELSLPDTKRLAGFVDRSKALRS